MTRALSSLHDPAPDGDYSRFPTYKVRARLRWYRVYKKKLNRSPWYFSSKEGRFNLLSPRGTLNLGQTAEVAFREALGLVLIGSGGRLPIEIPETSILGKKVACLEIPAVEVADFLDPAASAFGIVPGDISGPQADNYERTRKWAETLDKAGLGGIRSRSRFGVGEEPNCLYIFGPEGERELGSSDDLMSVADLLRTMSGYHIQPIPDSKSLIIEE